MDKNSIWVKYDNMFATSGSLGIFGDAGGPAPGSDPGQGRTSVQVASIGTLTYSRLPWSLTANVGYQRMNQTVLGSDFGKDYSTTLGIPGLNGDDIRDSGFPNVNINGFTGNWRAELDAALSNRRNLHHEPIACLDKRRSSVSVWLRPGATPPESLAARIKPRWASGVL